MQLEKNKIYTITANDIRYTFNINECHKGFYLNFSYYLNDVLFCRHHINKENLAKKNNRVL